MDKRDLAGDGAKDVRYAVTTRPELAKIVNSLLEIDAGRLANKGQSDKILPRVLLNVPFNRPTRSDAIL